MYMSIEYSAAAAQIFHASLDPASCYICRRGVVLEISIPPRMHNGIHMIVL